MCHGDNGMFQNGKDVRESRQRRLVTMTTPPRTPLPSLDLALILCSIEIINETLRAHETTEVDLERFPSRVGNVKGSKDFNRGSPTRDITRELQSIKPPKFSRSHASKQLETWLEAMIICFTLREYTSNLKANIEIFQLNDSDINSYYNS